MAFWSRRMLPKAYRELFAPGERTLAWAARPEGSLVVATNLGLWVDRARIGWHEITKAVWDGSTLVVTVSEVVDDSADPVVVADSAHLKLVLIDPGHLPHQVRLRVTGSIVRSEEQPDGSRLVGRRMPGVDGVAWTRWTPTRP
ncbi:MAG: hypothetical protein HOV71_06770 [Hamadaea sp.]|nr:hypothetical protein [Hamadaea sp.]NUR47822.1 hypothetical protein [Hamadaea sp.]NUT05419.1 hypothetical protein [Hamadaea sp.]